MIKAQIEIPKEVLEKISKLASIGWGLNNAEEELKKKAKALKRKRFKAETIRWILDKDEDEVNEFYRNAFNILENISVFVIKHRKELTENGKYRKVELTDGWVIYFKWERTPTRNRTRAREDEYLYISSKDPKIELETRTGEIRYPLKEK